MARSGGVGRLKGGEEQFGKAGRGSDDGIDTERGQAGGEGGVIAGLTDVVEGDDGNDTEPIFKNVGNGGEKVGAGVSIPEIADEKDGRAGRVASQCPAVVECLSDVRSTGEIEMEEDLNGVRKEVGQIGDAGIKADEVGSEGGDGRDDRGNDRRIEGGAGHRLA